jgi:hypothetical protein
MQKCEGEKMFKILLALCLLFYFLILSGSLLIGLKLYDFKDILSIYKKIIFRSFLAGTLADTLFVLLASFAHYDCTDYGEGCFLRFVLGL